MVRIAARRVGGLLLAFALALPVVAAPLPEGKAPKSAETPAEKIRKDLDRVVSVEFTEQPLPLAINQLREQTRITIVVDPTLQQMGLDPQTMPVSIALKEAKLRTVLRTILTPHNLSFAVIGDTILVSTDDLCMNRQMRQRVSVEVDRGDLATSLKKLARETGTNVVIDPRVSKEAATAVTLQLDDVPLDTAVRLMTEMASLKVVRVGNVMFICSKTQAAEMRQDPDFQPGAGGPPQQEEMKRQLLNLWQFNPQAMPANPIFPLPPPVATR